MLVQCVSLTNKGHRGVEVAAAERVHLLYKFHTLIRNVHKLLPKHWQLPSIAIISGGGKLIININYQGHIFDLQQK